MKNEIAFAQTLKKRQRFMCIKNYIMDDGEIAYYEGVEYISEKTGCLTDNQNDRFHKMDLNDKFNEHFEQIVL